MPSKRFLIAPLNSGFQNNVRPWLIPDEAFEQLENMYVFRGRLRKRFGSRYTIPSTAPTENTNQLFSRLRVEVGTLAAPSSPVPAASGAIGQMFSIENVIFTVYQATGNMLVTNGSATTATFDTTTGVFAFAGVLDSGGGAVNAATTIYWYPAFPVQGITQYERNSTLNKNDEPTLAFDTHYAYLWNDGWQRTGSAVWTGDNTNFFWAYTWRGNNLYDNLLFVSNFKFTVNAAIAQADPMYYYTGSTATWTSYTPIYDSSTGNTIYTARIIVGFKDRLLLFNVCQNEGGTIQHYANRCRYSQNGSPLDTAAFYENVGGRGGYLDAPTQEQIVSAEFLRDRLIVFFERSTWELVYTGNEILPFRWQQINTELGAESTFSIVPFDQVVLGIGESGIHACSGSSVTRIDDKIPDFVFDIRNEDGIERVQGIRDYGVEQVYWTLSDTEQTTEYPRKVLVYDYKGGNWSLNDDSITALGYFQNQSGLTWGRATMTWGEADFTWGSGFTQALYRQIIGGNQEGFIFVLDPGLNRNGGNLQITNISGTDNQTLTIVDNNLRQDDYICLENTNGITWTRDGAAVTNPVAQVLMVSGSTVTIKDIVGTGTYEGGATVALVSNPKILSKQYNFFNEIGTNVSLSQIDFMVDRTTNGEFTVKLLPSSAILGPSFDSSSFVVETRPYDPKFYPLEAVQDRLWHSMYGNVNGEVVQFQLNLSNDQMIDKDIAWSDLTIHAFMFHAQTTSSRFE